MEITKELNGKSLVIGIEGRLDTVTAPTLEETVSSVVDDINELTFDMSKLEYISSAGLRVLLSAQKKMNVNGKMIVKNVSSNVMEVLEITGFTDVLTIE